MSRSPVKFAAVTLAALVVLAGCAASQPDPPRTGGSQVSGETTGAAGCAPAFSDETPGDISKARLPMSEVAIEASGGERVVVRAEIADDSGEMAQGLMFRESLGKNCGMLFVYPGERELSFWMRNTLIPLSIAYIDSGGEIIDLQDMKALDDEPPNYTSAEPAQYALEVNVGFFEENGVEVGDSVELPQ